MTTKSAGLFYFNDELLYPLQEAAESLGSYYGPPGAEENKYLRGAEKDIESALAKLVKARDIKRAQWEKYEKEREGK